MTLRMSIRRPGQVRVRVRASSVNPIDWKIRAATWRRAQPLDGVGYLGLDAAGVVDEVGEGVTDVAVGDDVFGLGSNTIAEFAVLEAYARSRRRWTGLSPPPRVSRPRPRSVPSTLWG